jgi:multiple sugar transport system substrate-binding protein
MNKFTRKFILVAVALVTVLSLGSAAFPAKAQKTVVTWFVGLGTGTQPEQVKVQDAVVEKFNSSQDKIELKIQYAPNNQAAPDLLATLIASGNAPDIVGPVGFAGANSFPHTWLDLKPLVESTKYDLKQFPEALVNLYTDQTDGLIGIPFLVFPGLFYYNADLFDEADLAYPPAKFGEKYKLGDKEVDWDWNTVAEIAKLLTVDKDGNDATSDKFDPANIVQFGFEHQWDTIRSDFSTFGGANVVDANGKVVIPEAWRENAKWMWNAIWKDHFMPNDTYRNSDLLKPSAFASGKVAMARTMLWYTCCVSELKAKWDIAVVPSYKGNTYAPADADTFRIQKSTKNPEAAFTALQYLLGEAALDLATAYGGYPARPDLQDAAIKIKAEQNPSVKNWDLVAPSLQYAVAPGHEAAYPNFNKGQQRFADFATLLRGDTGKDIDIDKELDKLQSDLQAIVDAGDQPITAPTAAATP